ncbi:MAG: hypothetical protein IKE56_04060 [Lachnospiraceae bacterium]|nr:hypothetical protein [Lachnospiraceae bacterium]
MVMITVLKFMTDALVWYIFAAFFRAFFGIGVPTGLLMAPAALYVLWMIGKRYFGADYGHQLDKFRKIMLLFGILPLLAVLKLGDENGGFIELMRLIIPPLLMYLLLQILLFRILRQDPAVYTERRFQAFNLLLILGIGMLGAALSSTRILSGISRLLLLLWKGPVLALVSGILWVLLYTVGVVIYAVTTILLRLFSQGEMPTQETGGLPQAPDPAVFAETAGRSIPPWVMAVLMILAALIAIRLILKLFRLLADRTGMQGTAAAGRESRSRIAPSLSGRPQGRLSDLFSPAGRIRRCFRRLMKGLGDLPENVLSEDVAGKATGLAPARTAEIGELTSIYRRARYEDRREPVASGDAARAEQLEKEIRKDTIYKTTE